MPQEPGQASPHTGGSPRDTPHTTFFGPKTLAVVAFVAGVLVALLLAGSGIFVPAGTAAVSPGISPTACGEKIVQYINANQITPGNTASLVGVRENHGVYSVDITYSSENVTVYASGDCGLLFTDAINMSAPLPGSSGSASPAAASKSARPDVDLYVMSFCPYGTQAETAMKPVADLLGSDADFHVRYISSVTGSTPASVQSLHGPAEVQEDLRQVCINQQYPAQYWVYLERFDEQCYPLAGNSAALSACRQNLTTSLGMDDGAITSCAAGNASVGTLASDEAAADAAGAQGSPTLVVNGVTYNGARTPEAYKEAICNSFTAPPAACNTTLASDTAPAAGGCR